MAMETQCSTGVGAGVVSCKYPRMATHKLQTMICKPFFFQVILKEDSKKLVCATLSQQVPTKRGWVLVPTPARTRFESKGPPCLTNGRPLTFTTTRIVQPGASRCISRPMHYELQPFGTSACHKAEQSTGIVSPDGCKSYSAQVLGTTLRWDPDSSQVVFCYRNLAVLASVGSWSC